MSFDVTTPTSDNPESISNGTILSETVPNESNHQVIAMRETILEKVGTMDQEGLRKTLQFIVDGYNIKHGVVVSSYWDGIAILLVILTGLVADCSSFYKGKQFGIIYFDLAAVIMTFVHTLDNWFRDRRCDNYAALWLTVTHVGRQVLAGWNMKNLNVDYPVNLIFVLLIVPMISQYVSFSTASVAFIYLAVISIMARQWFAAIVVLGALIYFKGERLRVPSPVIDKIKKWGPYMVIPVIGYFQYAINNSQ